MEAVDQSISIVCPKLSLVHDPPEMCQSCQADFTQQRVRVEEFVQLVSLKVRQLENVLRGELLHVKLLLEEKDRTILKQKEVIQQFSSSLKYLLSVSNSADANVIHQVNDIAIALTDTFADPCQRDDSRWSGCNINCVNPTTFSLDDKLSVANSGDSTGLRSHGREDEPSPHDFSQSSSNADCGNLSNHNLTISVTEVDSSPRDQVEACFHDLSHTSQCPHDGHRDDPTEQEGPFGETTQDPNSSILTMRPIDPSEFHFLTEENPAIPHRSLTPVEEEPEINIYTAEHEQREFTSLGRWSKSTEDIPPSIVLRNKLGLGSDGDSKQMNRYSLCSFTSTCDTEDEGDNAISPFPSSNVLGKSYSRSSYDISYVSLDELKNYARSGTETSTLLQPQRPIGRSESYGPSRLGATRTASVSVNQLTSPHLTLSSKHKATRSQSFIRRDYNSDLAVAKEKKSRLENCISFLRSSSVRIKNSAKQSFDTIFEGGK